VCGGQVAIGPLELPGDAACSHCGHVLWFARRDVDNVAVLDVISGKVAINQQIDRVSQALIGEQDAPRVVLNLGRVQFVSSSFIAGLIALNRRLKTAGGQLILCEMRPVVLETLKGAKLDKLLTIVETEADALVSF
jgi:anti-anti-sigma factor